MQDKEKMFGNTHRTFDDNAKFEIYAKLLNSQILTTTVQEAKRLKLYLMNEYGISE